MGDSIAVDEGLVDGATAVIGLDNGDRAGNGLFDGGTVREGLDDGVMVGEALYAGGIVDKEFPRGLDIGSVIGKGSSDDGALFSVLDDGVDVCKGLVSGGALFEGFDGNGLWCGWSQVKACSISLSSICLVVLFCRMPDFSLDNASVRSGSAAMVILVSGMLICSI